MADTRDTSEIRGEVLDGVVLDRADAGVADQLGRIEQQGVAVPGGARHEFGADVAARPAPVVDHDRLPQTGRHARDHGARHTIHAGTCGKRHHHLDRPGGVGLGVDDRHDSSKQNEHKGAAQAAKRDECHGGLAMGGNEVVTERIVARAPSLGYRVAVEAFHRRTLTRLGITLVGQHCIHKGVCISEQQLRCFVIPVAPGVPDFHGLCPAVTQDGRRANFCQGNGVIQVIDFRHEAEREWKVGMNPQFRGGHLYVYTVSRCAQPGK